MKSKMFGRYFPKNRSAQAGFSMIEVIIVVGIVLVLAGVGSVSFISSLSRNRVASAVSIVKAQIQQARQSAIAMRQTRRVAINAGELAGMPDDLSGERLERASVWVEGKRCERFPFSASAACQNDTGSPNAYQITDVVFLPDGVTIAGLDENTTPGIGGMPRLFYFEFNPQGRLARVYFEGEETDSSVGPFQYPAVIHFMRDNERFEIGGQNLAYEAVRELPDLAEKVKDESNDFTERYKVQTLEVVRLTGKVRTYPYGYQSPWPFTLPESDR